MKKQQRDSPHGRAKRSLGQHFLMDEFAISTIVNAVAGGATAFEIGPGRGAITNQLRARTSHLLLIEKDDALAAHWQRQAATDSHLQLVHGDVLVVLEEQLTRYHPQWIVGNLPYNISGPLTALLVARNLPGGMVLMYQSEVAERIAAEPGCGRSCGGISVISRYCWQIERLITLPPEAFDPPPKVESAVLRFTPNGTTFCSTTFTALQWCVRRGFAHRRKTLANNFRDLCDDTLWQQTAIDPSLRPERLSMTQWLTLAEALQQRE
ncbi:MAG: 16S rRNA (adenine(1518)-N(6)/adenine(1519)-N(6))-dimethyltransferase RsmA [Mariprofundales bacterium]|nr:16S rRNA (adenine(1518)-N(6)/adenine(1519)-N(6))-dimethyltransferase RsmA [Mariprofundales bacterium]